MDTRRTPAENPEQGHGGAAAALAALTDLQVLSVDTRSGFEKMVEKAEPAFRPVAERFLALHTRQADRLAAMVREMGGVPDQDGTFMGSVNRAVISVRATFDAIDAQVMEQVHAGARNVLEAFDRALTASLPQGHIMALQDMRIALETLLREAPVRA